MLDDVKYIAIEGAIGVGKTSLARALAARFDARLVLEPADANPFLDQFYADMPKYALATQLVFLVNRHQQQDELAQLRLFERMVISDYVLARDKIFAGLTLRPDELALYHQLYDVMAPRAARPDVLVLLEADVDTLMHRIHGRGIAHEQDLTRDYVENLVAEYDAYFRFYDDTPLLVIDTGGLDYGQDALDVDRVIEEIDRARSGRRLYVPGKP